METNKNTISDYCDHCNTYTLVYIHDNYNSNGISTPFIFCERCFDYVVNGKECEICPCINNNCPCFKDINEHGEIGCVAPLKSGETMCERCIDYYCNQDMGNLITSFRNL